MPAAVRTRSSGLLSRLLRSVSKGVDLVTRFNFWNALQVDKCCTSVSAFPTHHCMYLRHVKYTYDTN